MTIGNPNHDIDALFASERKQAHLPVGPGMVDYNKMSKDMLFDNAYPKPGDVIEGVAIQQFDGQLMFSCPGKYDAAVPLTSKEVAVLRVIDTSQKLKLVVKGLDKDGSIIASVADYFVIEYKEEVETAMRYKQPIEVTVSRMTKAGYFAEYKGVELFISHFEIDINKSPNPEDYIGKTLSVMPTNQSRDYNCYQASRKKLLDVQAEQVALTLVRGQKYTGFVTGTSNFGVFVQLLDCLTGMIHKQNILDEYKETFQNIAPGTEIEFFYKETLSSGKIILTQVWQDSIWDALILGSVHEGIVEQDTKYGTLVRLDWDTVGIISSGELAKSNNKLTLGQKVKVKVQSIVRGEKKINFILAK